MQKDYDAMTDVQLMTEFATRNPADLFMDYVAMAQKMDRETCIALLRTDDFLKGKSKRPDVEP